MQPTRLEQEDGERSLSPQEQVAKALSAVSFDGELHPTVDEYQGQLIDALREGGTAVTDVLDQLAAAAKTDDEQALVAQLREQFDAAAEESGEDEPVSPEEQHFGETTKDPLAADRQNLGVERFMERHGIGEMTPGQIRRLLEIFRNYGEVADKLVGTGHQIADPTTRQEVAAMLYEDPEYHSATSRGEVPPEQAKAIEQIARAAVSAAADPVVGSSESADDQDVSPDEAPPAGEETVVSEAEPAASEPEPAAEAEDPETAAVGSETAVEEDRDGGGVESAVEAGVVEAEPIDEVFAEGQEEPLNPDETLSVAMEHDQLPREHNTFTETLADATEGVSDQEVATAIRAQLMAGVNKVLQRPHASLAEQIVAARQMREFGAELPAEKSIDALQEKMLDSVREQLAGHTPENLRRTIASLRDMAETMPETYTAFREQLADDPNFQSVEYDLGERITKMINNNIDASEKNQESSGTELPVYDDRVNELMADHRHLFGKAYQHPEDRTHEKIDFERKQDWQKRREKIMNGRDLAVPGGAFGKPPERGLKEFIGNFLLEIADDSELQGRLQEAISAMRKRWVLGSGNLAITGAQVGVKTRYLDQAAQLLEEAQAKATTS